MLQNPVFALPGCQRMSVNTLLRDTLGLAECFCTRLCSFACFCVWPRRLERPCLGLSDVSSAWFGFESLLQFKFHLFELRTFQSLSQIVFFVMLVFLLQQTVDACLVLWCADSCRCGGSTRNEHNFCLQLEAFLLTLVHSDTKLLQK